MDIVARIRTGFAAERLICHPRLPLIAGLEPDRPAIRVWRHEGGQLREIGLIGGGSVPYDDGDYRSDRGSRTPDAAWHPEEPQLVVAGADDLVRWTPDGIETLETVQPTIGFRQVAFSPDGRTLWLSPAPGWEHDWQRSIALDPATGETAAGPGWDTGVAVHPAGGLVTTLSSDQAETHVYFATITDGTPPVMRQLRRGLSLACDCYQTPVFSADGRYLAIRGGAYENFVVVFAFPSLRQVAGLGLGEPYPDPDPSWSFPNITFGAEPGVLWIGTPAGSLVEYDVDAGTLLEHPSITATITALTITAAGELAVASADGLLLVAATTATTATAATAATNADAATTATATATSESVIAFIESTEPAPPPTEDDEDEDEDEEGDGRFEFVESPPGPWIHVSPGSTPWRS